MMPSADGDGGGEDALALRGGGQVVGGDCLRAFAEAFPIGKEERLVLYNRSAEGEAELVALQDGLAGRRLEETDGVQRGVAEIFPRAAVKSVGAALGVGVDNGARAAAIFGAGVGGDDLNSPTASGESCTTWFEKPWFEVP
ncbi:MAG: hypothetical protein WDN31_05205 [Hyphomicrobium sp.]